MSGFDNPRVCRAIWICCVLGACFEPAFVDSPKCGPQGECPAGTLCFDGTCETSSCVDQINATPCSTRGVTDGVCFDGQCKARGCGDGQMLDAEDCDDGNLNPGDGCSVMCRFEACGNGDIDVVDNEQCDDGAIALAGDGCSATCQLEVESWRVLDTTIPGRAEPAMAYDPEHHRLVVFGGVAENDTPLDDTWVFENDTWRRAGIGTRPPARHAHAMVYDSARDRFLMFGMNGDPFVATSADLWSFDGHWTQLPTTPLVARPYPAVAYDSVRDRLVVFGGGLGGTFAANDIWEFDGTTWDTSFPTVKPIGGPSVGVYDPVRATTVIVTNDGTWEWNGSTWNQITALGPRSTMYAPVQFGSLAFDPVRGHVVYAFDGALHELIGSVWNEIATARSDLTETRIAFDTELGTLVRFGGVERDPTGHEADQFPHAVYELDASERWQIHPDVRVTPLVMTSITYDRSRGELVMFGGMTRDVSDETWLMDGHTWYRGPSGPPRRYNAALGFDEARREVVMFGGYDQTPPTARLFADTWIWNGTTWQERTTAHAPPAQLGALVTFDRQRQQLVLAGGPGRTDLWAWDGADWARVEIPNTLGLAQNETLLTFDYESDRHRIIAFTSEGRTFALDASGWTALVTPEMPPKRSSAARAVHDERGSIFVIGGWNADLTAKLDDVWEWRDDRWTRRLSFAGLGVTDGLAAYDPIIGQIIVFGVFQSDSGSPDAATLAFGFDSVDLDVEQEPCDGDPADHDGDGLVGCDDPDCRARCAPYCDPGAETCDPSQPHCGDAICQSPLEDHALCATDCP